MATKTKPINRTGRQCSLYLHGDLLDRLTQIAADEDRSLSYVVERAIEKYLENGKHKPTLEEQPDAQR